MVSFTEIDDVLANGQDKMSKPKLDYTSNFENILLDKQKFVLRLIFQENLSAKSVAQKLGVSKSSIEKICRRAFNRLGKGLAETMYKNKEIL